MRRLSVILLLPVLLSVGCVSAEREPQAMVSDVQQGGESLFREKCGMCHRANGMGTGLLGRRIEGNMALLENRRDLNSQFITAVVRNGQVNMQPLSRAEVSDGQLQKIADYLSGEGTR